MSRDPLNVDFANLSIGNLKRIRSLHLKKFRDAENAFLAEGVRLCEEALVSKVHIRQAVITEQAMSNARIMKIVEQCRRKDIPIFKATSEQFNLLSEEQSPQGVAFVVSKSSTKKMLRSAKLILALDHLQDPGNLGTILRSAEWFGVSEILLSSGCVDVYNSKVVRSSMGAIFRLEIHKVDLAQILGDLLAVGFRIIVTAAGAATALPDVTPSDHDVLVFGNEGSGIAPEIIELQNTAVAIDGGEHGESLNAAAAASIFLYHFKTATRTNSAF